MPSRTTTPPRPLIGICADYYAPKSGPAFARVNGGYVDSVLAAGGLPLILPPLRKENFAELEAMLDLVNGAVLVGGMDLNPSRLGLPATAAITPMAARREESDRHLLAKIVERRLPLLAIGVGMQLVNVHFGGTLFGHLPLDNPKAMPHYDQAGAVHRHMVALEAGSTLQEIFGPTELRVNSVHHQAVNQVGKRLRVGARSLDGVIEAIETTDESWFCVGTQWHPECDTASALDRQLFDHLVEHAMKYEGAGLAVA